MLFNSYEFIFLFLPIALAGFYLLLKFTKPDVAKLWLILMSAWFYCYFSVWYFLLLLGSVFFNYFLCTRLWKHRNKRILIVGVVMNLGLLFVFKYYNFFIENITGLFGGSFHALTLLLPLGISFYTFQEISFLADTYRGETAATKPVDFVLFILFFPQLVAGPIIAHESLLPNIKELTWKKADSTELSRGIYLFSFGLFKKVILADYLGSTVAFAYNNVPLLDSGSAALSIVCFALQIYLDFSGYSDMAIGLGRMFGFTLPMNFDRPFLSANIIDFWKRWHMTLTAFLSKNVYIPLGGNRKGKMRMYINLFLVFFVSGLWHGAAWTYVLWGVLNGVTYILTRLFLPQIQKLPSLLTGAFTFICSVAYIGVFRCESMEQAGALFSRLFSFTFTGLPVKMGETFRWPELWYVIKMLKLGYMPWVDYLCIGLIGVLLAVFLIVVEKKQMQRGTFELKTRMAVFSAVLFAWSVISLSSVTTFLYFNF